MSLITQGFSPIQSGVVTQGYNPVVVYGIQFNDGGGGTTYVYPSEKEYLERSFKFELDLIAEKFNVSANYYKIAIEKSMAVDKLLSILGIKEILKEVNFDIRALVTKDFKLEKNLSVTKISLVDEEVLVGSIKECDLRYSKVLYGIKSKTSKMERNISAEKIQPVWLVKSVAGKKAILLNKEIFINGEQEIDIRKILMALTSVD